MIKLNCVVVDDEPLAAGLIAGYIEKTPFMELRGTFYSAQDAIRTIMEGNIDIVFLDIQMPQLNGMEFAKILPPSTRIIFTTAYDSYAVEGFRLNALDYLLKPVSYPEFAQSASRALEWAKMRRNAAEEAVGPEHIIVKSEYKLIQIPVADILFIEGLKDYVKIFVEGHDRSIMTLMSMKTLEQSLPPSRFMRVHRSFIVNTSKIKMIERNRIVIANNYIPVSESYKQAFNDFITSRSLVAGE